MRIPEHLQRVRVNLSCAGQDANGGICLVELGNPTVEVAVVMIRQLVEDRGWVAGPGFLLCPVHAGNPTLSNPKPQPPAKSKLRLVR